MNDIILIGMPASGKSTAGKLLAARKNFLFLDGDDLIRAYTGEALDETISRVGTEGFLAIEEEVLCGIREEGAVIATGGSAVYSPRAMAHLKMLGKVVYLKISEEEIGRRIPDFHARGVVMRGEISTLRELYAERAPLYENYADLTVECGGRTPEEVAEELLLL